MFVYSGIIPYILRAEIICDCKPSTCQTSSGHIDINQGTSQELQGFLPSTNFGTAADDSRTTYEV